MYVVSLGKLFLVFLLGVEDVWLSILCIIAAGWLGEVCSRFGEYGSREEIDEMDDAEEEVADDGAGTAEGVDTYGIITIGCIGCMEWGGKGDILPK